MRATLSILLLLLLTSISLAGPLRRPVPLEEAPEVSHLPWLILFTPDNWQGDMRSVQVKSWLEGNARLMAGCRYNHITPSSSRYAGYSRYHNNSLPAVVIAAPVPKVRNDIWACVRNEGLPDTAGELTELLPLKKPDVYTQILPWRRPRPDDDCPDCNPQPDEKKPPEKPRPLSPPTSVFPDAGLVKKVNDLETEKKGLLARITGLDGERRGLISNLSTLREQGKQTVSEFLSRIAKLKSGALALLMGVGGLFILKDLLLE